MKYSPFITVGVVGAAAFGISYIANNPAPKPTTITTKTDQVSTEPVFCNGVVVNWAVPGSGGTFKTLDHPRDYLSLFTKKTENVCSSRNFLSIGDWDAVMIYFVNRFNPGIVYHMVIPPEVRNVGTFETPNPIQ